MNILQFNTRKEAGALLAGAMVISAALAISMVALLTFSRETNRQAESVLSKSRLSRMAQEKFTRDLSALRNGFNGTVVSTTPAHFADGEAESFYQMVPAEIKNFGTSVYCVVIATLAKSDAMQPRHLRIESIIEIQPQAVPVAPPPPPTASSRFSHNKEEVSVNDYIIDQLRQYIDESDPRFEEVKKMVLSQLEAQLGFNPENLSVTAEPAQYRDPFIAETVEAAETQKDGAFYMAPLSIDSSQESVRVRMWKETYF